MALALSVALGGCAGPKFEGRTRDDVFARAVEASLAERPEVAAANAYNYYKGSSVDDPRYDRALRLMAANAEKLGLSYAASLWYLEIARARRDVSILGESLRGIERIILTYPYDEETLMRGFISTAEITGLPPDQQGFVNYYKGLDSLRLRRDGWAALTFSQIPDSSPYRLRADYVRIMQAVAGYDLEEAELMLEELLEVEDIPNDLRLDVTRTLARIAFEEQRFRDAMRYYEIIRQDAPNDPSLLLEMAWTTYYKGEYQRALGLLLALDAPVYRGLIAPERYLLEALTLRKLCQFEPAQRAAVRLQMRHGDAIDDLYDGVPLQESVALRRAARQRIGGRKIARYRLQLERERASLDDLERKLGPELTKGLRAIYETGVKEAVRREDAQLQAEMIRVADDLLAAEEGVRLILHELGVALLRGRRRTQDGGGPQEIAQQKVDPQKEIQYTFVGEFWTDELDDLVVNVEDRCID